MRSFGADFTVYASGGQLHVDGRDAHPSDGRAMLRGDAQIVPGLAEQVVRTGDGGVEVAAVPDVTGGRTFTFLAMFRAWPAAAYRRVAGRVNGGTEVSLGLDREGRVRATVGSAKGGYRTTLTGTSVVADGRWHAASIVGLPRVFNGLALELNVDDEQERTGSISPGLFGTSPNYTMGAGVPVVVGQAADGTALLQGEVAAVAGADRAWDNETTTARLWNDLQGVSGAGFVGWGIPLA